MFAGVRVATDNAAYSPHPGSALVWAPRAASRAAIQIYQIADPRDRKLLAIAGVFLEHNAKSVARCSTIDE